MELLTINPATGESLPARAYQSGAQVEEILARAAVAQREWGRASFADRGKVLNAVAALLRQQRDVLARTISIEMGKPIAEAEGEIDKSAWNCEYVASNAERWLGDDVIKTNATLSYVSHRPLGVVLAILPWNFPVWQIFRAAVSALMAGTPFC